MTDVNINIDADPLDIARAYAWLGDPASGAVVCFTGRVRDHHHGRSVMALHYEAYEAMATAECERIWYKATKRWPIRRGIIWHRLGTLGIGEAAVIVGVAAPHRQAAFAASSFLIDTLKERVPIWKQEQAQQGGALWINDPPLSSPEERVDDSGATRPNS